MSEKVTLQDLLTPARKLILDQEFSFSDGFAALSM
jgi:hypothetical protein